MTTELRLEKTFGVTKSKHLPSTLFTTKLLGFWVLRPFHACEKPKHQTKISVKQMHKSDLSSHSRDPCPAASSRDAGQETQGEKAGGCRDRHLPAGSAEPCRFCWLLKQSISAFQGGQLWKGMDERVKLTPPLWGSTGG